LTRAAEPASNKSVVSTGPSREETLLSDHVFYFFGHAFTLTSHVQFLAILVVVIAATAWSVQQFRRKRSVVLQSSAVSNQVTYELSRIADALERIANRPVDQIIASAGIPEEKPSGGRIPYSMFGR
jgi:hypothetical protein